MRNAYTETLPIVDVPIATRCKREVARFCNMTSEIVRGIGLDVID